MDASVLLWMTVPPKSMSIYKSLLSRYCNPDTLHFESCWIYYCDCDASMGLCLLRVSMLHRLCFRYPKLAVFYCWRYAILFTNTKYQVQRPTVLLCCQLLHNISYASLPLSNISYPWFSSLRHSRNFFFLGWYILLGELIKWYLWLNSKVWMIY